MKRLLITLALVAVMAVPCLAGKDEPSYGFRFGGFFKTDLIYDTTRLVPGNYALYVPAFEGDDNNEFFLTARESRFIIDFWWKDECFKTKGYLEFDFQNAGSGENKPAPMLRQIYFKFGKSSWSILAGQTWDIISPLNPSTANYSVLWYQGNIGYRRPQLRFSTWTETGDNTKFTLDAGVSRNIGGDLDYDADGVNVDDGADAGVPAIQGRLGLYTKIGDKTKMALGVSGHAGKETFGEGDRESINSWSVNIDLALDFGKRFGFKGEFFTGENLSQYLGGIGQSVNPLNNSLPSTGGWGMLTFKPKSKLTMNLGYGIDHPDEDEWAVPGDGADYTLMKMNDIIFGNIFVDLSSNIQAIFEVSKMKTEHVTYNNDGSDVTETSEDFKDLRFQFALKCTIK